MQLVKMDLSVIRFVMVSYLCGWAMATGLQKTVFMDNFTSYGRSYTIYDTDLLAIAHKHTGSNPPLRCEITIQTGYLASKSGLVIRQEAITIQDCAFKLDIYTGESASKHIKTLSCISQSTGVLYTNSRYAKLILIRPDDLFQPANTFTLKIRTWRDPELQEGNQSTVVPAGLQRAVFMDSMTFCGQLYTVHDIDLLVVAHEQTTRSIPPKSCEITIQTGYSDPKFELQIRLETINIQDCAFKLDIYAGQSALHYIKTLSCNSKSAGVIYTNNGFAKLILTRPDDLFQPANNFKLRIRTWQEPEVERSTTLDLVSKGAIIVNDSRLVVCIVFATMLS